MADFKTHIQFSTLTGIAYGSGLYLLGVPAPTSAIATGVCAMAGMLPDIDSKSSRALQECLYLMAGLVCVHILTRLAEFSINGDLVLLIGVASFVLTKVVLGEFVKKHTKHRGLMHSIPMAILAGEITFLLSAGDVATRIIKAVALFLGFSSHLLLDEIYSVDVRGVRLKKSFGTALKLYNKATPYRSFFVYVLIFVSGYLLTHETRWSEEFKTKAQRFATISAEKLQKYSENAYSDSIVDEWNYWFMSYYYDSHYADSFFGDDDVDEEYPEDDYYDDDSYDIQYADIHNKNNVSQVSEYRTSGYDAGQNYGRNRQSSLSYSAPVGQDRTDNKSQTASLFYRNDEIVPPQNTNGNQTRRPFSREASPRYSSAASPSLPQVAPQQTAPPSRASRTSIFSMPPKSPVVQPQQNDTTAPGAGKLFRSSAPITPR